VLIFLSKELNYENRVFLKERAPRLLNILERKGVEKNILQVLLSLCSLPQQWIRLKDIADRVNLSSKKVALILNDLGTPFSHIKKRTNGYYFVLVFREDVEVRLRTM